MKLLIISPDFLSHYLPLSAVAAAARDAGADVTVATGDALRSRVITDGSRWARLRLARSANAGTPQLDADLRAFFDSTRHGMIATLLEQARARGQDLLWQPAAVARNTLALIDAAQPDAVLVDHLAFGATLALRSASVPFTTFVPGHPSQLPTQDEVYGCPVGWPRSIEVERNELVELRRRCEDVATRFTDRYNDALHALNPVAAPVVDAFAAHGHDVMFNSHETLADRGRQISFPHVFLGSCVRLEVADDDVGAWLARHGGGFVFVSFGTFLSARADVLRTVLGALRGRGRLVAVATGAAAVEDLGDLPPDWLVAPSLPQVALLEHAGLVVTHGGNNTVTEALTAGVPLVVAPFSTDQFAIAADVERSGVGVAVGPNRASADSWSRAIDSVAAAPSIAQRTTALGAALRARPGPAIATRRLGLAGSAPHDGR